MTCCERLTVVRMSISRSNGSEQLEVLKKCVAGRVHRIVVVVCEHACPGVHQYLCVHVQVFACVCVCVDAHHCATSGSCHQLGDSSDIDVSGVGLLRG